MGTSFNEICDLAYHTLFANYKLDNLLKNDESMFYSFLSGMVLNSTTMFNGVLNGLSFHEETSLNEENMEENVIYVFDRILTYKEKYILALGVSIGLYKRELDDVTIYAGHLSAKEFKEVGNDRNLKARQERLAQMQEELANEITSYQIETMDADGMYFWGV